ncbi:IS66 family transposase [Martelella alba]|uniref:IS66 family transposase n=1 Tax=Martelella alba TaxID=2590451 RepID=A0ABY2SJZ0_9HYPH|nr:IS66 family transposase [Martelella alba]TKI05044.1 IS66 family transposase [Martelella alba]
MDIDSLLASQNPDDLRALALKLLSEIQAREAVVSSLRADLERQAQENQAQTRYIRQLEEALENARRWRFGHKSDAFHGEQRELFDEDIDADAADITRQLVAQLPGAAAHKPERPKRRPLSPLLPRQDSLLAPATDICPRCGHALRFIRDEVSERLEYAPDRFIVHRHIRPQLGCPRCDIVVSAPLPAQLIETGQPGPGLLARVVCAKALDHLPLYRQRDIYQRGGADISRSTLAGWFGAVGAALRPLAEALHRDLLRHSVLQADETPLLLLDAVRGKSQRGYLWAYVTVQDAGRVIVLYDCQPGCGGHYAREVLKGWHGTLVVDGNAGRRALFDLSRVTEAGCLAHVRRKFSEPLTANPSPVVKHALNILRGLYQLERTIEARPAVKKRRWRQRYAKPQMEAFHQWLLLQQSQAVPHSRLSKALDYTLNRWPALVRYLEDGRLPIDNNHCENLMRPVAAGRKNRLFAGSLRAGQRLAAILSLLETARLNGHDPYLWLREVLARLPDWPGNRISELLPYAENRFD